MKVGMRVSTKQSGPSGITLESTSMLFDPNNSFSFFTKNKTAGRLQTTTLIFIVQCWVSAVYGQQRNADFNFLQNLFGLTERQMTLVCNWLANGFFPTFLYPDYFKKFQIDQIQ